MPTVATDPTTTTASSTTGVRRTYWRPSRRLRPTAPTDSGRSIRRPMLSSCSFIISSPTMTARKLAALIAKAVATPNAPMARPAAAGPMTRAALNMAELSATAGPTSSRPTISTANAWRTGMSTALAMPSRNARTRIIQTWTTFVNDQDGKDRREDHHAGLGPEQDATLRQGVRQDAGEQAEDHDRDELGGRHDAQPDRVVGQLEDEPGLRDLLHPGPDERDRLAGEEQPVVAVAEGAQPVRRARRRGLNVARPIIGRPGRAARRRLVVPRAPGRARRGGHRGAPDARRASSIIDASRAALVSRISICRSTRSAGVEEQRAALVRIAGLAQAGAVALACRVVLEQLADLGEREAGVVAQAPDEPQAIEVRRVVQPVVALGSGGRLEQADLLVVADRAGRQAGLRGDLVDPQQGRVGVGLGGVGRF